MTVPALLCVVAASLMHVAAARTKPPYIVLDTSGTELP